MNDGDVKIRPAWLTWLAVVIATAPAWGEGGKVLWQIGKPDADNGEFALAPGSYRDFKEGAFFVVGRSRAERDWPYVQPGPGDAWAGGRRHTFRVVFAVKGRLEDGSSRLRLDLIDTHAAHPPALRVVVNGSESDKPLGKGAGDASINGEPTKGEPSRCEVTFPAALLKEGENEIAITTVSGSWLLYDAVTLYTPEGVELAPVAERTELSGAQVLPVVKLEGGNETRPVQLSLRHVGDEADAVLRVGGADAAPLRLRSGAQQVEVNIPSARAAGGPVAVQVVAGGKLLAERQVTVAAPRLREVWLLPHSHVDIGYTHRQAEVVDLQIGNLEKAMELAATTAGNAEGMRFKWNPEAIWTIDHYLRRATREQRERFIRAVRAREVGLDGLYANVLTALCRPEELARVVSYAPRLSGQTGVAVDSAAICDVPGYTWGITSAMAQAGIRYFAIGPNFSDRVGTIHAAWDQKPFYWVSPSGRERVLCWIVDHYWFGGDLEEHALKYLAAQEQRGFPYDMGYIYWTGRWPNGGVDNAPPDEQIAEKVRAWNAKYASPRIVIATASEFFSEFEKKHGARLPEFKGDLTPYWEDGAGSSARETGMNRASGDRLVQAEALWALLAPARRPAPRFEEAWRNVILYSEHTWGAWNSISAPDDAFVTDQWQVKQGFALDADRQSRQLVADALVSRGRTVGGLSAIDVFNTTQWPRTDLVIVPKELAAAGSGDRVMDTVGNGVPSQRLASGELAFLAGEVPAFGARRYVISAGPARAGGSAKARGHILSTTDLTVRLSPMTGAIDSMRCAGLEHEFVDVESPVALNDYRYVLGGDASGARGNDRVKMTVLDDGPLVATLRVESPAPGCESLVREVRVIDGLGRVEITNHVDRKAVREKDAVHFGFGFNVPGGVVRMETPWAVVRPNTDQLPGSCRNWFTVQRWVDVSNDEFGVTWAPLDAPLVEIGQITANLMGSVALNQWMTEAIESQTIYSWAMNNHWYTNYRADQPGLTTFRYMLRPHKGGYSGPEAFRFGVERTRPLIVAPAAGAVPADAPGLTVVPPSVLVEAVKMSEDGKALIVRLFGASGQDEAVTLSFGDGAPRECWLSDLGEAPRQRLDGPVPVPAYGMVTVRLSLP